MATYGTIGFDVDDEFGVFAGSDIPPFSGVSYLKKGTNVRQTATSTGTNTLSLGVISGYNKFVDQIGNYNTCCYWLFDANQSQWEYGIGTVLGATLTRNYVLGSSNNNKLITLSASTPHIATNDFIPQLAEIGVNYHDLLVMSPELRDYSETVWQPSIVSGVLTLNLELANVFSVNHNANITTLTVLNPPVSGKAGSFTLHLTQDATGGRTFPTAQANLSWGVTPIPTISTTANKRNKLVFDTINGGSTWDIGYCGVF